MILSNPGFQNNYVSIYDFITKINIRDKAIVHKYDGNSNQIIEGYISSISERGITIVTLNRTNFYKWYHVKEIHKN